MDFCWLVTTSVVVQCIRQLHWKDMDKYTLNVNIGHKKTELTQLSPVSIGEAVPCLGNFVDFSFLEKENETEIPDTNTQANVQACTFKILISSAN